MNTSPHLLDGSEGSFRSGDFGGPPAFDALYVYQQLQTACQALEQVEEHAAAAFVAHAMSMVQTRFDVGVDHRAEP